MQCHAQFTKQTRAYTLLEVMLAATLLGLAFVGMTQVIISGSNMLDMSRKQTIATQIIHAEIEQVRLQKWTTVNGLIGTSSTVDIGTLTSTNSLSSSTFGYPELMTFKNIAKNFTAVRVVSYVSGRTDMVAITFTVTWKSNMRTGDLVGGVIVPGKSFSRTGTTYFSKNGLFVSYQKS